ncbi:hypothetical protein NM208_g2538 [Fusarium decemcellulare]|uniref:Uncharacterized protein n=2 Tax=Fusarium decemcellulare TaxID=57161 RepID=A0ACC1SSA2_9HYPO|nr:hypothetical protein NM208_g3528 [Fusarium decemcellulare]KAJ3545376.1 hypothetical protein NM208_g2538 [Fusarium decemcellulare]
MLQSHRSEKQRDLVTTVIMDKDNLDLTALEQRLCDVCKNLRFPLESEFQQHVHGYDQLVLRAARCAFCNLACQGLRREFVSTATMSMAGSDMDLIDKEIIASVIIDDDNPFILGIPGWVAIRSRERSPEQKRSVPREQFADCIDVCISPRAYCTLMISPSGACLQDNTNRPSWAIDVLGRGLSPEWGLQELYPAWAMICQDAAYMQGKADKPLPSRIIDVSHGLRSIFPDQVRLVEPESQSRGVYLALSHRWGSSRHITTTRSNITVHRKGIPLQNLPRTFQEAIAICRMMYIQYLWIDSLCIVQDDAAEWERESKLMGDIYHNGLFTIASHAAKSDEEGFLTSVSRKQNVTMRGKGNSTFEVSMPSEFSRDIACNSAISWRGWVLQERLLSTKILHFLPSQLYLESTGDKVISVNTGLHHYVDTVPSLVSVYDREKRTQRWHEIVEWYSRCALTKETDKLPALSGIATIFQRVSHDDYLAGLWARDFYKDLLWLSADGTRSKRPRTPRASTWSWASLDGAVAYIPSTNHESGPDVKINHCSLLVLDQKQLYREIAKNNHDPVWIDRPVPLHVIAKIEKLPQLGHCSEASSAQVTGNINIRYLLSEYSNLSSSLFRPIMLDGNTIGLVVVDVESEGLPEQNSLRYIKLGSTSCSYIILVISLDSQRVNVYKRVGLGFLSSSATTEDGYRYLLPYNLQSEEDQENIVLV